MQLKNLLIGSGIGLFFFAVYVTSGGISHAATKSVSILNNSFTPSILSAVEGDTIVWTNNDTIGHRLDILNATDSSLVIGNDLLPKVSTSTAGRTLSRKFNDTGDFIYRLDQQASISGQLTIFPLITVETPTPTAIFSPTPTATATATATPTISPTATPTVQPTATASPSAIPTIAPTPTVSPTMIPTSTPTVVPTASPTILPTATPTIAPTASPSATPTSIPTVAPTASPTLAPTASPTMSPVPTVVPTISPTATPTPGEVLPAFSVFRRTSCTAALVNNATQIRTDKLNAITLKRGTWNVLSLQNNPPTVSAQVKLISVRTVNLMFGNNPFFGLDRTVAANFTTTFTDTSVDGVLGDARDAWCGM
jgi:plastocyanin